MNAPRPPRCALASIATDQADTEAIKRDGWKQHGILVININDSRLTFAWREILNQIGDKLYGKRYR